MNKPKKWTEVYPQGTKEGNEEQKFFISLARNPKYEWRSTGMITKEAGLPRKRVEEIIAKYLKMGLIVPSPTKEEHWAYWERVPGMLKDNTKSITDNDQNNRIGKQLDGSADMQTFGARLFSDAPNANNEIYTANGYDYRFTAMPFDSPIFLQAGEQLSMSCTFTIPDNVGITITDAIPDKIVIDSTNIPDKIDLNLLVGDSVNLNTPNKIEDCWFAANGANRGQVPNVEDVVSQWDFNTALGETIREKYENEYVKVVEVTNVGSRQNLLEEDWTLDV